MPVTLVLTFDFEGRPIAANPGEPVAVALWRAGERVLGRSPKYHRPRGVQCMEGHCGGCLMRIDGVPSQLACQVAVRDGMRVERQNAFPSASHDLLRATDWAFARTFNHHEMFARVPIAREVMAKVAHKLAGLGELPEAVGEPFAPGGELSVGTLLIGLGRTGRAQLPSLGPGDLAIDARPVDAHPQAWPEAMALGIYEDAGLPVVAVRRDSQLVQVRPQRVVLRTGSRAQVPAGEGHDLPGVITDVAAKVLAGYGLEVGPDVTVVTGRRAPAFELGAQAGAEIVEAAGGGFAIATDASGQTRIPWLSAFGSCSAGVGLVRGRTGCASGPKPDGGPGELAKPTPRGR